MSFCRRATYLLWSWCHVGEKGIISWKKIARPRYVKLFIAICPWLPVMMYEIHVVINFANWLNPFRQFIQYYQLTTFLFNCTITAHVSKRQHANADKANVKMAGCKPKEGTPTDATFFDLTCGLKWLRTNTISNEYKLPLTITLKQIRYHYSNCLDFTHIFWALL